MKNIFFVFGLILFLSASACAGPQVTLLANSIDLELSRAYLENLEASGIDVTVVSATDFPKHKADTFILILGGHHAPEGVGEIVSGLLTESEKRDLVSSPDARYVYVIPEPFAVKQRLMVFAGYGKEQTRKAFGDAQGDLMKTLRFNESLYPENNSVAESVPALDPLQPFTEINAYQAYALIEKAPDLVIVDVRGVPFYDAGHIPGAINLPVSILEDGAVTLSKEATYLVYCGGNSESIRAGSLLASKGYRKVYRLVDGYMAWRKAGYPKEKTEIIASSS